MWRNLKREISGCENIILRVTEKQDSLFETIKKFNSEKSDQKEMTASFCQKIEDLVHKIDQSIVGKEEKTKQIWANVLQSTNECDDSKKGKITTKEFRKILAEEREKQKKEDDDRKRRLNNVIIHGAMESENEFEAVRK